MGKKILAMWILCGMSLFLLTGTVSAHFHPENNKVGISIIEPSDGDIASAFEMIGEGGWVTIVLKEDAISVGELQEIYNKVREKNGVLIERWATGSVDDRGNWSRPDDATIEFFANLYKQTRPPHETRFILLGNEVNHGAEFGGACDPTVYGRWAAAASKRIKEEGIKSVVMLAALDVDSPESRPAFCDAARFHTEMIQNVPNVYDNIDAFSHHCYPSAGSKFHGTATNTGRYSVLCHEWERGVIMNAVNSNPLISEETKQKMRSFKSYITETGWAHGSAGISTEQAASNMKIALERWQQDPSIYAVTPFVFKYLTPPFNKFSFVAGESNSLNLVGEVVKNFPKQKGGPIHIRKSTCFGTFPRSVVENVSYSIDIECVNNGTDIWRGVRGNYDLQVQSPFSTQCSSFDTVAPGHRFKVTCTVNPGRTSGCPTFNVGMAIDGGLSMNMLNTKMCVTPPPSLKLTKVRGFPGFELNNETVLIEVFKESNEALVARFEAEVVNGVADIPAVDGVNLDDRYRIVVIRDGSLPVQVVRVVFQQGMNEHEIPMFLAIDRNQDGAFSLSDVLRSYSE